MNGDETSMIWSIGLITFAFGLAAGYAINFYLNPDNKRRGKLQQELDLLQQELEQVKAEAEQYRGEVAEHFQHTSELVQEMTSSYKNVYEHLASGSARLCKDAIQEPQLDFAMRKEITGNGLDTEVNVPDAPTDFAGSDR